MRNAGDFTTPPYLKLYSSTMVRRKSILATRSDIQIHQAILDVQSGKYKSSYEAERGSVMRRAHKLASNNRK